VSTGLSTALGLKQHQGGGLDDPHVPHFAPPTLCCPHATACVLSAGSGMCPACLWRVVCAGEKAAVGWAAEGLLLVTPSHAAYPGRVGQLVYVAGCSCLDAAGLNRLHLFYLSVSGEHAAAHARAASPMRCPCLLKCHRWQTTVCAGVWYSLQGCAQC